MPKHYRGTVFASIVSYQKAPMSVCPGIGDIKFDHLAKGVTALFSMVKTSFSIVFEPVAGLRLAEH